MHNQLFSSGKANNRVSAGLIMSDQAGRADRMITSGQRTGFSHGRRRAPRGHMKKTTVLLFLLLAIFLGTGISIAETLMNSEPLPEVVLTVPDNKGFIDYMGLKWGPGTPFKLSDIDADILMIELFSMYCPYCQKAAPNVNELYELMEKNRRPDLKLVLIGIGVKNTPLEVETFRQGYNIRFPLFSDMDLSIYKSLGGAGTPTFVACKKEGGKKVIFFRKAGGFANPTQFFENLLTDSGLK